LEDELMIAHGDVIVIPQNDRLVCDHPIDQHTVQAAQIIQHKLPALISNFSVKA
jgi:hypothetical protein